jgi:hypothetical protein
VAEAGIVFQSLQHLVLQELMLQQQFKSVIAKAAIAKSSESSGRNSGRPRYHLLCTAGVAGREDAGVRVQERRNGDECSHMHTRVRARAHSNIMFSLAYSLGLLSCCRMKSVRRCHISTSSPSLQFILVQSSQNPPCCFRSTARFFLSPRRSRLPTGCCMPPSATRTALRRAPSSSHRL